MMGCGSGGIRRVWVVWLDGVRATGALRWWSGNGVVF